MDQRICRHCLLNELKEKEYYRKAKAYIDSIDNDIKTDQQQYNKRLSECQNCPRLINGMCTLCGCFVEIRAAACYNTCPDTPKRW